jgi:hypothetical protein
MSPSQNQPYVTGNDIDAEGVEAFAPCLKVPRQLTTLDLGCESLLIV